MFKLELIGISAFIIHQIGAYLKDRRQSVEVGGHQGTVLGPPLFLIYRNDLVDVIADGAFIRLFADGRAVFKTISCENDYLLRQAIETIDGVRDGV